MTHEEWLATRPGDRLRAALDRRRAARDAWALKAAHDEIATIFYGEAESIAEALVRAPASVERTRDRRTNSVPIEIISTALANQDSRVYREKLETILCWLKQDRDQ